MFDVEFPKLSNEPQITANIHHLVGQNRFGRWRTLPKNENFATQALCTIFSDFVPVGYKKLTMYQFGVVEIKCLRQKIRCLLDCLVDWLEKIAKISHMTHVSTGNCKRNSIKLISG